MEEAVNNDSVHSTAAGNSEGHDAHILEGSQHDLAKVAHNRSTDENVLTLSHIPLVVFPENISLQINNYIQTPALVYGFYWNYKRTDFKKMTLESNTQGGIL